MTHQSRCSRPQVLRVAVTRLAFLALAVTFCSGCSQLLAIGRNAVVMGVAVDAEPGGHIRTTVQMYHHGGPTGQVGEGGRGTGGGGSSGGGGTSKPLVITLHGTGSDFAQAITSVQAQTDERIGFWATQLLLIGHGMAHRGVRQSLDALLRDGDFSLLTQVAVVAGNAGKLLQSHQPGGSAEEISDRLEHSAGTATGSIPVPFWRFMARLSTPYNAAWAPVLALTTQGYRAAGIAVFRGDTLANILGQSQSQALGWILKPGGFGSVTFKIPQTGDPVTLNIVARKKHLKLSSTAEATIMLSLNANVQQGARISLRRSLARRSLEQAAAVAVSHQLRIALTSLQAAGTDVIGFGELERERDPALAAQWPAIFHKMHIQVNVSVHVLPSGRIA